MPPARLDSGTALNGLREALRSPQTRMVASFVLIPRVEIVELLAVTGFDAVVLDLEHGPFTVTELPPLVAAARGAGVRAIVRVGEASDVTIGNVLDVGPDGILVPHVSSEAEAQRVVEATRFPPAGGRSINPYVRGLNYAAQDTDDLAVADRGTALIAMIEGKDGLAAFESICTIEEIDAVFFGPVDLSAALGYPNQPEHPAVVACIGECFDALAEAGRAGAVYAPTAEAACRWFDLGARLVAVSADVAMIHRSFTDMQEALTV